MAKFILGVLIVLVIWFFYSIRSKMKAYYAFSLFDEAEPWLTKEGFKISSIYFTVYNDSRLAKHPRAAVIVGEGYKFDGNFVGFVVEVIPGSGVVDGVCIEPSGIVSHHRFASIYAKMYGKSLMDIMQEMARRHRAKYGIK